MAPPIPSTHSSVQGSSLPLKNRFQYFDLDMRYTEVAWAAQATQPVIRTAQQVARATLFPLLCIAAFEAIVKNGLLLIANLGIALANRVSRKFCPTATAL